jgi:hypothetical protein
MMKVSTSLILILKNRKVKKTKKTKRLPIKMFLDVTLLKKWKKEVKLIQVQTQRQKMIL